MTRAIVCVAAFAAAALSATRFATSVKHSRRSRARVFRSSLPVERQ
jgi:hypothetical protein